jgi:DNA-binding NtrC family response regulator
MAHRIAVPTTALQSTDAVEEALQLAARFDVPVLITAETLEERERFARIIHIASSCSRGPFVALSKETIVAHAERARGGTLFVEDIARLDTSGQAHLFALLDERLSLVCAWRSQRGRVRVIAGARHHLYRERHSGAFSESLFYRLNIVHVDLTRVVPGEPAARESSTQFERT